MRTQKVYEPKDMMIDLIRDNYNVLQALGSFGINLGFGDKTVEEVCKDNGVDCRTFLIVVNFISGTKNSNMSMSALCCITFRPTINIIWISSCLS